MRIHIVTLFPEFFQGPLSCGLMQRARENGILSLSFHNPRDLALDRHRTVDDRPYGGGPGMVMLPGPLAGTLEGLGFAQRGRPQPGRLLFLAPKGRPLDQDLARELAREPSMTLICGRYEGIDSRLEEHFPIESVSVGDFVLNGGEAAAVCLLEAVGRLAPGFMGHEDSGEEESFSGGLLEYPHYTRPEIFEGRRVPDVLRSGDHARIGAWRRRESLRVTLENRPDLLEQALLTPEDRAFLQTLPVCRPGRNLYVGLVHYPVLDREKNSVAVSLTNLDIHDIARSSCTYGLGGYTVITPIEDQRKLLDDILRHWTQGAGKRSNPDRDAALSLVRPAGSIQEAVTAIARETGQEPAVIGTTARVDAQTDVGFRQVRRMLGSRPVLVLLGTGHGLAPEAQALCQGFLPPVRWHGRYNHLSVRAAAAIIFDRLLGDWY